MTRFNLLVPILLCVILFLSINPLGPSQPAKVIAEQGFGLNRSTSLTIKIMFLGISANDLNSTYLTSSVTIPQIKYQTILAGPVNTGVVYNFNYQLVFANNSTTTNFVKYLQSIQQSQTTFANRRYPSDLVNPYFTNSSTLAYTQNYFYGADKVESWLDTNLIQSGGNPIPGYTLFIADLSGLGIPSFSYAEYQGYNLRCGATCTKTVVNAHYYNRTVIDPDFNLTATRHFMTGWGGSGRFYFMDLSAGPSYWTNELPVQVASKLRGVSVDTPYGKLWKSKFVGDYVFGAVYNLFAADQLYPVNYSQNYDVHLFVIDNRTASEITQGPSLAQSINKTTIRASLSSLVPFSTVNVAVTSAKVTDYPGLADVIGNATTSLTDPLTGRRIVDADLVYRWLTTSGLGHVTDFTNTVRTSSRIDIPGFIFAFKGNYTFGTPVKEEIASKGSQRTFAGEALGDMVLIGLSQSDFRLGDNSTYSQPGNGVGFTHAAIHELGHMMGLNHPFIYDQTEDFTDTVMGYYAYSLNYSEFDRDTIMRGVNDELLSLAQETLAETQNTPFNSGYISMAEQNTAQAIRLYDNMDYNGAVPYSLAAANDAYTAQQFASRPFPPSFAFTLIGIAIGTGIGFLLGYLIFKKRRQSGGIQYNRCPTCQQPLRWDPAQARWYCDRCQKQV